ncbi:MAG: hypothetical protein HFG89_04730 [Dorea sp.]|jgi:hypothetical protein|nr:hypothetical protein [Dorea sp.]
MSFSILSNSLVNKDNSTALRKGLFEAQTLSYRKILSQSWRDELLPDIECLSKNTYYKVLQTLFDDWDAAAVLSQLTENDDLTKAVNSLRIKGCKSIRRSKKQSTRVYKEVRKMWKKGYYGCPKEREKEMEDALKNIHKAFRESFIILRLVLRKEVYDCIPSKLKVTLHNGNIYNISSLYIYDKALNKYKLDQEITFTFKDLRYIQLSITPYIFSKIHIR